MGSGSRPYTQTAPLPNIKNLRAKLITAFAAQKPSILPSNIQRVLDEEGAELAQRASRPWLLLPLASRAGFIGKNAAPLMQTPKYWYLFSADDFSFLEFGTEWEARRMANIISTEERPSSASRNISPIHAGNDVWVFVKDDDEFMTIMKEVEKERRWMKVEIELGKKDVGRLSGFSNPDGLKVWTEREIKLREELKKSLGMGKGDEEKGEVEGSVFWLHVKAALVKIRRGEI